MDWWYCPYVLPENLGVRPELFAYDISGLLRVDARISITSPMLFFAMSGTVASGGREAHRDQNKRTLVLRPAEATGKTSHRPGRIRQGSQAAHAQRRLNESRRDPAGRLHSV